MTRKFTFCLCAFMAFALLIGVSPVFAADQAPPPAPPPPYLSEKLANLDGSGEVTVQQVLKNDKNLFVFFQSACAACKTEIKALKEAFGSDSKVNIIGIGVDVRKDSLVAFVTDIGYPKTVYWDPDFSVAPKMRIYSTPGAVLIGKDGKYLDRFLGFTPETVSEIKAKIK